MMNLKWVGITILLLTIFGYFSNKSEPDEAPVPVQNPSTITLLNYTLQSNEAAILEHLISKETSNFASSGQSMLKTIHKLVTTTATEVTKDYKENELAANEKYLKKNLLISGKIESTYSEKGSDPYITLQGIKDSASPQANFTKSNLEKVPALKSGDELTLICESEGIVAGKLALNECQFAQEFSVQKIAELKSDVDSFLNGGKPSTDNPAILAIMAISLARTLPAKSTCFNDKSQCEQDLESAMKDYDLKKTVTLVSNELKSVGLHVPEQ